jgi:hypothetical protein
MYGLETSFHEAMHQWDDSLLTIIGTLANRLAVSAPVDLAHQSDLLHGRRGRAPRVAGPRAVRRALRAGDRDAVIGEIVRRIAPPR